MRADRYEKALHLITSGLFKVDLNSGEVFKRLSNGDYIQAKYISPNGYKLVSKNVNKKPFQVYVHELVLVAAGYDLTGKEINHKNGVKYDNRLENLEISTRSANIQHAYDTGLLKKSLNEQQINEIKEKLALGVDFYTLCYQYKLSDTTMRKYLKN